MNYKVYIYALMLFLSVFATSGLNFEGIIKRNHIYEAKALVILLIMSLTYLSASFIISFIEVL
ncbi:MAG: DUF1146 domain-containing protein [Firmicutes bacterium]|nr:DUF1146 domain-containing protein [Bacillota bacterium]